MIRIAICDNDTAASDKLAASIKTLAASHKANCQIRCFSKGTPLLYEVEDSIQFDLFFLETQLPDMDGFLLAKKIKEHQSDCLFLLYPIRLMRFSMLFNCLRFVFCQKHISKNGWKKHSYLRFHK